MVNDIDGTNVCYAIGVIAAETVVATLSLFVASVAVTVNELANEGE
jgi:hypothetical protein